MDKMLSVHSKKPNKHPKTKKKPVKVVYISNPMKVKVSASEFRALVQQLTGQHADYSINPDPCIREANKKGCYLMESPPSTDDLHGDHHKHHVEEDHHHHGVVDEVPNNSTEAMTDNSELSFEDYGGAGEDYVPELLDNLPGLMASSLWYD